jgi:hypothetical protein
VEKLSQLTELNLFWTTAVYYIFLEIESVYLIMGGFDEEAL